MEINRKKLTKYGILGILVLFLLVYPTQIYQAFLKVLSIGMPLILGAMLAYVLNILVRRIEGILWPNSKRKIIVKSRRGIAILLSLIVITLIISIVARLVIPQFISALEELFKSIPSVLTDISNYAKSINKNSLLAEQLSNSNIDWSSIEEKVTKFVTTGASEAFSSTFGIITGIASGLFDFILALTFAIYILASKEKLTSQVNRVSKAFIKSTHLDKIRYFLTTANNMFSSFIVGQVTEAIILGSLCTIGMLIFRFPYAFSVGAFVSVTALIPIIGAWLGGTVGFFLIAVKSPIQALIFVLFILVLQEVEGKLIYPRVVGTSIGLPGIWVLASITIGGGVSGIFGMLLGVPIAATIYQLLKNETNRRLSKQSAQN